MGRGGLVGRDLAGGRLGGLFSGEHFEVKIRAVDFGAATTAMQMGQICRSGHVILSLAKRADEEQHLRLFVEEQEQKVVIHGINNESRVIGRLSDNATVADSETNRRTESP